MVGGTGDYGDKWGPGLGAQALPPLDSDHADLSPDQQRATLISCGWVTSPETQPAVIFLTA